MWFMLMSNQGTSVMCGSRRRRRRRRRRVCFFACMASLGWMCAPALRGGDSQCKQPIAAFHFHAGGHGKEVLAGIKHFTQLVQDTSELVGAVLCSYCAVVCLCCAVLRL